MSDQFRVAVARAAYGGVLAGLGVALLTYNQTSSVSKSALAGAAALVTYLAARGGVEGYVDTQRAAKT